MLSPVGPCRIEAEPGFVDDFLGVSLDQARWTSRDGVGANGVRFTPSAVMVAGGEVVLTASPDGSSGGIVLNQPQVYGRFELRVRLSSASSAISGSVGLWPEASGPDGAESISISTVGTGWQTLVIDWTPSALTVLREGTTVDSVVTGVPSGSQVLAIELDPGSATLAAPVSMEIGLVEIRSYLGC